MKPAHRAESSPTKSSRKRLHRPRPMPRWLKAPAEGPEAVAQRRCQLVLAVLSGEKPVTDAIGEAAISRPLYYQWEEKALRAILRALSPAADASESMAWTTAQKLAEALARIRQLEREKRRAERLLLLTRKMVRPGPLVTGNQGPRGPRKGALASTPVGPKASRSSTTLTPVPASDGIASSPGAPGVTTQ